MSSNQFTNNLFSVVPIGSHQRVNVLTTAVTVTLPVNATGMIVQAGDQNVKYVIGGALPDVNVGFMLRSTDVPVRLDLFPGAKISFIETVVGGSINYMFFRSV